MPDRIRRGRPTACVSIVLLLLGSLIITVGDAVPASAAVTKYANDNRGTGWYPGQTGLTPAVVSSGNFGRIWDTKVNGSIYAQPVINNGTVLIATLSNWIYGLDSTTGAIKWSRFLGTPWNPFDINCPDLSPTLGTVGTPVIDAATNRAYFFTKSYASGNAGPAAYTAHGIDLETGVELPGFPVAIRGGAANDPSTVFNPTTQMQRPGLILLDGVVYAAFGGHCDHPVYQGWVVGVTTSGSISTMWTNQPRQSGNPGGGIWQSGGSIVSDGPGQLLFAVGNGNITDRPTAGRTPPETLGESMVRLAVQPDRSLKATDFFSPYDASTLNDADADLGSGAPVLLPPAQFGTPRTPHLAVLAGKQGYLYILNADDLGGYQQGPNGSDKVIGRLGQFGGLWSKPAVWGGDGGYIYMAPAGRPMMALKYGLDGTGKPTFRKVGETSDAFGERAGAPVVSSVGTTSGTALLWTIWTADKAGSNAQLRAYDPVPVNGTLRLRWSTPVGTAAKFTSPIIDGDRIYLGTADGRVQMFTYPTDSLVSSTSVSFPRTTVGQSSTASLTLHALKNLTVTRLSSSSSDITLSRPSLPTTVRAGEDLTVPVSFTPSTTKTYAETITVTTDSVPIQISVSGIGQYASAHLEMAPDSTNISFGGVALGSGSVTASVTIRNTGAQSAVITKVNLPSAPFTITGAPTIGASLAPGEELIATAEFATATLGLHDGSFSVESNGGTATTHLTGIIGTPPRLVIGSTVVTRPGAVEVGRPVELSTTLRNSGGTALVINRSKPPTATNFVVSSLVPEGETIQPGESITASVIITPRYAGTVSDVWEFNGSDGLGVRKVTFSVTGAASPAPGPITSAGWTRNGDATVSGSDVVLTPKDRINSVGTTFWSHPVSFSGLRVSFDMYMGGSPTVGGEGMAFVFGAVDQLDINTAGYPGGSLGFGGMNAQGICFDTYQNLKRNEPSSNFISACSPVNRQLYMRQPTNVSIPMRNSVRRVTITFASKKAIITVDGITVGALPVSYLPEFATIGFSAANGVDDHTDLHRISNVRITNVVNNPQLGGWTVNGGASTKTLGFNLTGTDTRGSAFLTAALSGGLTAEFDLNLRGANSGGGTTFALLDATASAPTALGADGAGLGWAGAGPGIAVAFDRAMDAGDPSANFVGITTSGGPAPVWLATTTAILSLTAKVYRARIVVTPTQLTVALDGTTVLTRAISLPSRYHPGFTATRGGLTGAHPISGLSITQT
ncbi:MAG: choice-of-anchor D domain-containing protein [Acidobacteria bacterium]|nr:choice-of-anchor D domain-containing protein [Acidobacteriota bacterium]